MSEKIIVTVSHTNSIPGGEVKNGQVPTMHNPPPPPKTNTDKK